MTPVNCQNGAEAFIDNSSVQFEPTGVSIVFPCLNEEKTLAKCLGEATVTLAAAGRPFELIVADNGSSDRSVEVAKSHGARVVHVSQRGYGAAVRAGLAAAQYPVAVMLDCDLSYPISEIPSLLSKTDEGYEFVLGNRMNRKLERGAMPVLHRRVGTPILSRMIRSLTGLPVYDSNSGLRAIRRDLLDRMSLQATGMEFASEMLMAAASLKAKYKEVPIRFVKDQRGRQSHLRPWSDGLRHVNLIVRRHLSRQMKG